MSTPATTDIRPVFNLGQYTKLYNYVLKHVQKGSKVLDWGAGDLHFSAFLLESGYESHAYVHNQSSLIGGDRGIAVKVGDGEPVKIPYADESFDVVFSVGVLEHVHESGGDSQKSVQEIIRILKPGGKFIVYHLPAKGTWIEPVAALMNRKFNKNHHIHTRLFGKADVQAIEQLQFKLLKKERYAFLPRNVLATMLPWSLKRSRVLSSFYSGLDQVLSTIFPFFTQNYFLVFQKSLL